MNNLVIEKGVPIPEKKAAGCGVVVALKSMEVGDSVFICGKSTTQLGGGVAHVQRITGRRFTSRKEADGCRIWRIA
jgi:short-subunit dehydrogenase involved in D-alanine esterification of teichoic acids